MDYKDLANLYQEFNETLHKFVAHILHKTKDNPSVQDIVSVAWAKLSKRINEGNPPHTPKAWLRTTAKHDAWAFTKKYGKEPVWGEVFPGAEISQGLCYDDVDVDAEIIKIFEQVATNMTAKELAVMYMFWQNFKWTEMRSTIGIAHTALNKVRHSVRDKARLFFSDSF